MSTFAIPLQPQPSAVDVLKRIPSEAFKKVPKGKIPTGIPNSTLSYVEAAGAAGALHELYGADFDVNGYLEGIREKMTEWEAHTKTTIEEIKTTSERYVPVQGDEQIIALPVGQSFDIKLEVTTTVTETPGDSDTFSENRWLRGITGEIIAPYSTTVLSKTTHRTGLSSISQLILILPQLSPRFQVIRPSWEKLRRNLESDQ